jgi:hypothetical protein
MNVIFLGKWWWSIGWNRESPIFRHPAHHSSFFWRCFWRFFSPVRGRSGQTTKIHWDHRTFFAHLQSFSWKVTDGRGCGWVQKFSRKGTQLSRIWSGSKPNDFIWSHMNPYEPIGPQFGWWYCSCPILWVEVVNLYPSPTHGFSHFGEVLGATEKLLQGMATWVTNSNPLWIMWEYNLL